MFKQSFTHHSETGRTVRVDVVFENVHEDEIDDICVFDALVETLKFHVLHIVPKELGGSYS